VTAQRPAPPEGLTCYCAGGDGPHYAQPAPGQSELCDQCGCRSLYDIAPRRPAEPVPPAPRQAPRNRIVSPSPLGLSLEPLENAPAQYLADAEVARALRTSGVWQPWSDFSRTDGVWYADPWEELGEPLAGWQASGGLQGRKCRIYLVRMPEPRPYGNRYPAERGRWALRDVETVGPAAGYGLTRFFRSEAAARAAVESTACSAQAIGYSYLRGGSAAAVAADLADKLATARQIAWQRDKSLTWDESPSDAARRALGLEREAARAEDAQAAFVQDAGVAEAESAVVGPAAGPRGALPGEGLERGAAPVDAAQDVLRAARVVVDLEHLPVREALADQPAVQQDPPLRAADLGVLPAEAALVEGARDGVEGASEVDLSVSGDHRGGHAESVSGRPARVKRKPRDGAHTPNVRHRAAREGT